MNSLILHGKGATRGSYNEEGNCILCPVSAPSRRHVTKEFIFVHLIATFLPDVPELLQGGADLLARGDAHPPQVVTADGETRDGPSEELLQQRLLALILQELADFTLGIQLPTLKGEETRVDGLWFL